MQITKIDSGAVTFTVDPDEARLLASAITAAIENDAEGFNDDNTAETMAATFEAAAVAGFAGVVSNDPRLTIAKGAA